MRYFENSDGQVFAYDSTQGDLIAKALADGMKEITGAWPPPPAAPSAADNEARAKTLLAATDWSQLADVGATLQNKSAFDAYRAELRAVATSPVAGDLVWPVCPTAVWS